MIRRQIILLCGFLLAISMLVDWQSISLPSLTQLLPPLPDDSVLSAKAYQLANNKPLRFPLEKHQSNVKLVLNAGVEPHALKTLNVEDKIEYAIKYAFLDANFNVIDQQLYHFRTGINKPEYMLAKDWPIKYRDRNTIALKGQVAVLQTSSSASRFIEISLHDSHPTLSNTVIRVYGKAKVGANELGVTWLRTSPEEKARLTKANIHPYEIVSEEEKKALIKNRWKPLGPIGVDGTEFLTVRLYMNTDKDIENEFYQEIIPDGRIITPTFDTTFILPKVDQSSYLDIKRLDDDTEEQVLITTEIYSDPKEPPLTRKFPVTSIRTEIPLPETNKSTFIHVKCNCNASLNITSSTNAVTAPKTPDYIWLRTYLVTEQPLSYDVIHGNSQATPLRFDFRTSANELTEKQIIIFLLDEQENIIKQLPINLLNSHSMLHALFSELPSGGAVSEVTRRYINASKNVASVKIVNKTPESPVYVSAYTKIPGGYETVAYSQGFQVNDNKALPNWFVFRPNQSEALYRNNFTALLAINTSPPDYHDSNISADYLWERYAPLNATQAAFFFVPTDATQSLNDLQLSSTFSEISNLSTQKIKWTLPFGAKTITPKLFLANAEFNNTLPMVKLDGVNVQYQKSSGRHYTEISLPAVGRNSHVLSLTGTALTNISVYSNYIQNSNNKLRKQLAYLLLPGDSLEFNVSKLKPETLINISAFSQSTMPNNKWFTASLLNDKQQSNLPSKFSTATQRRFELNDASFDLAFIYPASEKRYQKRNAFFPLADDINIGKKKLRIMSESQQAIYIVLTNLIEGEFSRMNLFSEDKF